MTTMTTITTRAAITTITITIMMTTITTKAAITTITITIMMTTITTRAAAAATTTTTTSKDDVPMALPFNSNMADESDNEKDYSSVIPFP